MVVGITVTQSFLTRTIIYLCACIRLVCNITLRRCTNLICSILSKFVGLLNGPSALSGTQTELNEVMFTWSPPYTLEGVPILGYKLNIQVIGNLNETLLSNYYASINDTSLIVSRPESENNCIFVNISVNATNVVGDGETVFSIFYFSEGNSISKLIVMHVNIPIKAR